MFRRILPKAVTLGEAHLTKSFSSTATAHIFTLFGTATNTSAKSPSFNIERSTAKSNKYFSKNKSIDKPAHSFVSSIKHEGKVGEAKASEAKLSVPDLVHLPVIDALVDKAKQEMSEFPLRKTIIVYIHHALETSVNVIDSMIKLGADPHNVFVLGKHYSECPEVVEQIEKYGVQYTKCSAQTGLGKFSESFTRDIVRVWQKVESRLGKAKDIDKVLVIDHGGNALKYAPDSVIKRKVIGIEKTTGGIVHLKDGLPNFPVINMANCAAKVLLEPPLIADAVLKKLEPLFPKITNSKLSCGVVGYGAIGKAIADKLISLDHEVIIYDKDPHKLINAAGMKTNDLSALIGNAEVIFGCTGDDISVSLDHFRLSTRDKTLISCSSEDKEFLTLLHEIQRLKNGKVASQPLNTVTYETASKFKKTITILRGGFPVNFDNSAESVPAKDIQLTRALVLGSILQAVKFFDKPASILEMSGLYSVDPKVQQFIVNEWIKDLAASNRQLPSQGVIDKFNDAAWVIQNSNGIYEPCKVFDEESAEENIVTSKFSR